MIIASMSNSHLKMKIFIIELVWKKSSFLNSYDVANLDLNIETPSDINIQSLMKYKQNSQILCPLTSEVI